MGKQQEKGGDGAGTLWSLADYFCYENPAVVKENGERMRLRYLHGHSKGRRREVYDVVSRHWAQLQ